MGEDKQQQVCVNWRHISRVNKCLKLTFYVGKEWPLESVSNHFHLGHQSLSLPISPGPLSSNVSSFSAQTNNNNNGGVSSIDRPFSFLIYDGRFGAKTVLVPFMFPLHCCLAFIHLILLSQDTYTHLNAEGSPVSLRPWPSSDGDLFKYPNRCPLYRKIKQ